jgi:monofunctional biosynthetic peptidoglycan transglycosylase
MTNAAPHPASRRRYKRRWIAAAALAAAALIFWAAMDLARAPVPGVAALKNKNPQTTAFIELRKKQARRQGKKMSVRHQWAPLGRIAPLLKHAVVAAEDEGFYGHDGVEWASMRQAVKENVARRAYAKGGSTITQQLARNLYLSPKKSLWRKGRELLIAFRLEEHLSKNRILELYLNSVEWGPGIFGAESAAQAYYGKSAADLTVDEAVALAAVLPSPRRNNPTIDTRWTKMRRDWIMQRLVKQGHIPYILPDLAVPDIPVPEPEDQSEDEES